MGGGLVSQEAAVEEGYYWIRCLGNIYVAEYISPLGGGRGYWLLPGEEAALPAPYEGVEVLSGRLVAPKALEGTVV